MCTLPALLSLLSPLGIVPDSSSVLLAHLLGKHTVEVGKLKKADLSLLSTVTSPQLYK
jgi:hypothetical protein